MPTLYERLQLYRQRPDALQFSAKKLRKLAFTVARNWDKYRGSKQNLGLIESVEDGTTYQVRDYPPDYVPVIDSIIRFYHGFLSKKHAQPTPSAKSSPPLRARSSPPNNTLLHPPDPGGVPRTRKRIPTPAFSGKTLLNRSKL